MGWCSCYKKYKVRATKLNGPHLVTCEGHFGSYLRSKCYICHEGRALLPSNYILWTARYIVGLIK